VRDGVDELLAAQDAGDVLVVEDSRDTGQPQRLTGPRASCSGVLP